MKRFLMVLIAALMCMAASAQSYTVGGVTYYLTEDGVSTRVIDVAGGRQGVAHFKIEYKADPEAVILTVEVTGHFPLLSDNHDGESVEPASVIFKDGSSLRVSGSCDEWSGMAANTNTVNIEFHDFSACYRAFGKLRGKDISQIRVRGGNHVSISGLGASSATIIDNLCRLMEVEGAVPEGLLGKSPHHHWAIDKEINGTFTRSIGDTLVVDGHPGIIFELSSCGAHGKVISLEVSEPMPLFDGFHEGFGNYSYSNGRANTRALKAVRGWEDHFPALRWCATLGPSWYLPAYNEMFYGAKVLEEKGIIASDDDLYHTHSTYGAYSVIVGDIDISDVEGKLVYTPMPTRAVATF
ncbi:MAG: hypothetical protein J5769_03575 [Bacteroidales bacterium]|nr:hypothetical protein [Bacteroidales bacterium]